MGKVFYESDYMKFKPSPYAQEVSKVALKSFISSISQYGQLEPIVVDKNMTVLDGKYRLEALKSLMLPVKYRIMGDTEKRELLESLEQRINEMVQSREL